MNGITLLKFFATILITNSHFGNLYPIGFQIFATGGTIGNSLFFFISGYTLFFSNKEHFTKWITKRFLRVLIPFWIFLIFRIIVGESFSIINFVIPNYWFIQAILLFYLLYFLILKYLGNRLWIPFFIIVILYLIIFYFDKHNEWIIELTNNPTKLHWNYYFLLMLFGAFYANNKNEMNPTSFKVKEFLVLIISIIIYYGFKQFVISNQLYVFQFLIPIPLFSICWYSLKITNKFALKISDFYSRIIQFISNLILEIYIVQFIIIKLMIRLDYQLKFFFAIFLIILSAFLLNYISLKIRNKILK